MNYPSVIYQTPAEWGAVSYLTVSQVSRLIRGLKRELGWDCSIDQCARWERFSGTTYQSATPTDRDYLGRAQYSQIDFERINGNWRPVSAIPDRVSAHEAAATLGKRGGSKTSEAKVRAARENGRRGGRPRKSMES